MEKCQSLWEGGDRQCLLLTAIMKSFSKDAVIFEDSRLDMTRFCF